MGPVESAKKTPLASYYSPLLLLFITMDPPRFYTTYKQNRPASDFIIERAKVYKSYNYYRVCLFPLFLAWLIS